MTGSAGLGRSVLSSIADISFIGLLAPLPHGKAYGMSKSLATARQSTLVVLKTEAGTEGVGEAWGVPQVNMAYLPLLKSYLFGADVTDVELVFARILARHYHFGLQNQMMACLKGLDIAAKDAVGKETGVTRLPPHRRTRSIKCPSTRRAATSPRSRSAIFPPDRGDGRSWACGRQDQDRTGPPERRGGASHSLATVSGARSTSWSTLIRTIPSTSQEPR